MTTGVSLGRLKKMTTSAEGGRGGQGYKARRKLVVHSGALGERSEMIAEVITKAIKIYLSVILQFRIS